MTLRLVAPILPSPDLAQTATFYQAIGFSVQLRMDEYLIVVRDGVEIHFWPCADRAVAEASGCYLRVDDPASWDDAARAAGARTLRPETKPWGMYEGAIWDPAGNLLRLGRPA